MAEYALASRVGLIHAISDNVLPATIPLLEVLPAYRGEGIEAALEAPVEMIVDRPSGFQIRNGQTGAILFAGRVVEPSAS